MFFLNDTCFFLKTLVSLNLKQCLVYLKTMPDLLEMTVWFIGKQCFIICNSCLLKKMDVTYRQLQYF